MTRKPTQKTSDAVKVECNAPDCHREPTTRGLCDAHWATLRGLADPKD